MLPESRIFLTRQFDHTLPKSITLHAQNDFNSSTILHIHPHLTTTTRPRARAASSLLSVRCGGGEESYSRPFLVRFPPFRPLVCVSRVPQSEVTPPGVSAVGAMRKRNLRESSS